MSEFTPWHNETVGGAVVEALKKNGFEAEFFATADEAGQRLLDLIPDRASVGIGGSTTLKTLGVPEKLAARGASVSR